MIGPGSDKKGEDIDGGDGSDVGVFLLNFCMLVQGAQRSVLYCATLCKLGFAPIIPTINLL